MSRIEYITDTSGNFQETHGSDGRLNVSSRADARSYYNSRDVEQTYSFVWDFQGAVATEDACYLKNTSTTGKTLVVSSIGLNAASAQRFKLKFVTATPANGTTITPTNLNGHSSNAATVIAEEAASAANGITNLTDGGIIDFAYVVAGGHEELRLGDRVRLGQNDAIAIENFEGSGDCSGVIFFYFE